jgi:D-beta-D-heptose 7-phosphate kinase/D-beta-D-heptose 1-phosphate adenosyltransferase
MDASLIKILDRFSKLRILVLGDVMLDKYIWGKVSRISPEAPVQIVLVENETYAPGGAANVANNVAELGGLVTIIGVRGDDSAGQLLVKELRRRSIVTDNLLTDPSRPTIQKVRLIAHSQQLIRFDYEKYDKFSDSLVKSINNAIEANIKNVDCLVISDYAKGFIDDRVMRCVLDNAAKYKKSIIIDPRPKNKHLYKNATVICPNFSEACAMTGMEPENEESFELLGQTLLQMMNSNIVITRGEKGMSIFNKDGAVMHIPTKAREVYDVTGAGDTAVATLALALSAGATLEEAAIIANYAAGVVVGKVGTSTVTVGEIRDSLQHE